MALLWDASLTDAGVSMISQWAQGTGNKLTITGGVIGEGVVSASQLHALTQLTDQKSTISIQGFESVANGVKLKLRKTSQGITTSFTLNQIGIYAKLDTSGGTPIIADSLIAVYQQDTGILVPTEADSPDFVFTFYGTIQTNYQGDLTINVDTSAILSQDDIADNLVTADATMALSANMGVKIADNLAANENVYGAKNLAILDLGAIMSINTGGTWSGNVYSHRSVDFTVTDNGVSVSGTASGGAAFIDIPLSPLTNGEKYIANGISGGADETYQIKFMNSSLVVQSVSDLYDGERTFEKNTTNQNVEIYRIRVASGATVATEIYPMLRDARVIDPTFAPYAETNLQLTRKTSGLSNENLLDNPFFTVNQRGATTVTANFTYGADRWKKVDGTSAVFDSSGVTLNAQINQALENQIPNGIYTATVKYSDGTYESGTVTKANDTNTIRFINRVGLTIGYVASSKQFYIYTDVNVTIRAVKLERGTVSTLANDVAPNYTTELLECQRYFYRLKALSAYAFFSSGVMGDATAYWGIINLPVPMRATPQITSAGSVYIRQGTNVLTSNITCELRSPNILSIFAVSATSLTAGAAALLLLDSTSSYIDFSADL